MPLNISHLNTEQQNAVTHGAGPLLLVAGAGTGKTAVITHRIAHLIDQGSAKSNEILALTFTEKAAAEMEERIDRLLPYGYIDLWVSTFHSFADRLLKTHALDIGISNEYKLLTQTDAWLLVRKNLEKFDLDYYRPLGNPTKFIHALLKHFSRCKDEAISPAEYLKHAERLQLDTDLPLDENVADHTTEIKRIAEIANAYHVYNQLLLDNNALDFGDLLVYTLKLLKERPLILKTYQDKFKYVLVDEFQDTNWAQYELIKLVAGKPANITVVGDDDQSIYKFRGASVSNILQFEKEYPSAQKIFLTTNYRSYQNLLDSSYAFIQLNNPNRLEYQLQKTDGDSALTKKLTADRKGTGAIEYHGAQTLEAETRFVAERIRALYEEQKGACAWNDFAILVRANNQADPFMNALERRGIPYQFLASSGLYRQRLILNICAYLRLLDNYHENTATFRVLNMELWNLPPEDVVKITHQARKKSWSLYEVMKHAASIGVLQESQIIINRILGLVERHSQMAKDKPVSVVALQFLQDSGLLQDLVRKEGRGDAYALKEVRLLKLFFEEIRDFENRTTEQTVKHFMEELDFILDSGDSGALPVDTTDGPESVKILTVHNAKGLEFRYVFVVSLIDLKFPSTDRPDPIQIPDALIREMLPEGDVHLEEERRLFYVALTRARDGIYLTSAKDYGGARSRKPSRFLIEMKLTTKEGSAGETAKTALESPTEATSQKEMHNDLSHLIPKMFSFTQLKAFETCPLQYKFAHILRIPLAGKPSFSFGKTMHSTMQKFYERMIELNNWKQTDLFAARESDASVQAVEIKVPPLEEMLKFYEESWIDKWYSNKKQKQEYREKGIKIIKEFYTKHEGSWRIPQFLELGFTLKVEGNPLRGAIDRVDQTPDGSVEIIDYKTGTPKEETKLAAEDKEQLILYQIAATESLNLKPRLLSFYYLENNSTISFLGSEEEINKLKDKITRIIEQIKASNFPAKPSPHTCKFCDFKNICDFAAL